MLIETFSLTTMIVNKIRDIRENKVKKIFTLFEKKNNLIKLKLSKTLTCNEGNVIFLVMVKGKCP